MTPSRAPKTPHVWGTLAHVGQGPVEMCTLCGVRRTEPDAGEYCKPVVTPPKVLHDYNPFG